MGQRKRDAPQHFAHEGAKDRGPKFDSVPARGQGWGILLQAPGKGDAFAPCERCRDAVRECIQLGGVGIMGSKPQAPQVVVWDGQQVAGLHMGPQSATMLMSVARIPSL